MLRELSIKNFAIIDDLHICFSNGLTILSGETGAGKSIILNAVNLLLGSRATIQLIRTDAESAELEATFQIAFKSRVSEIMVQHGYNSSEELLIRRIISRNGRHRIYINGRLATIQLLNSITENLASISGQHEHQGLLKEEQQLLILDQFGGLVPLRKQVSKLFHEILPLITELKKLNAIKDRQSEHIELLEFQKKEIIQTSITPGEDSALEKERMRLKNGETLYQAVHDSIEALYNTQGAVVERLVEVRRNLDRVCQIDSELSSAAKGVADTTFQIEDIIEELRNYLKNIQIDETRLEDVEARLDILQKLKRKYGGSLDAVIAHLESIEHELSEVENISDKINATEAKLSELHSQLAKLALKLSEKRDHTAINLAKKLEMELTTLKMSQTQFQVFLRTISAGDKADPYLTIDGKTIDETGIDCASFLIAPNVGEDLKPLAGIASGGELSRVVLALKAILAETESVETVVFDEVDAGIGGGVAEVVGKKLSFLARHHQVICITHLPQIAKFGDHHFKISKHVEQGRTITNIDPLGDEERIKEIARMLGGVEITRATIDHAREMLDA
jgi:DNA repair protein RecN (Recombination protein N)